MRNQRALVRVGSWAVLLSVGLLLSGCSSATDIWKETKGKGPHVLVSFPPLYCFAKNVAGDHAKVVSLTVTKGPHHYSPTAHDGMMARDAHLFLVNGLGLDEWILKVQKSARNSRLKVIELGESDKLKSRWIKSKEAEGGHTHGPHDPHLWLGIEEAIALVELIRDRLGEQAPDYKKSYTKNAATYIDKLKKLHAYGKKKFRDLTNKRIIATHDSLVYFGRSFGIEIADNIQPQPGIKADANKLQDLLTLLQNKKKPIRVITVEPQYSKRTAETLIRQLKNKGVDVKMVEFDTLEMAPSRSELTKDLYHTVMKQNIDRLAEALK